MSNCSNCNRESSNFSRESSSCGCSLESSTFSRESNNRDCDENQHVHEFLGSTLSNGRCNQCHSHRFATVSEEAIRSGNSHVHKVTLRTDSIDGHFHEFCGTSGPAIFVGEGRHVHFLSGCTESSDGHTHTFRAASLINDPTDEDDECECRRERRCDCR